MARNASEALGGRTGWLDRMSARMRQRRFSLFEERAGRLPRPIRILDIGGRATFWERYGWAGRKDVWIVTGNIEQQEKRQDNIEPMQVDATNMSGFADASLDIVFSNSVIEHLFSWENQMRMAREVRRIGRAYWLQTPNYWFPLEPHFRFPGWHWLPTGIRIALLRRRGFGLRGRCPDLDHATRIVREIRLLTRRELRTLFPDGQLIAERWGGLVKSWVACRSL